MDELPRVLVISNTALKRSNSNGDTILSLLSQLPFDHVMSFYLQNAIPDKDAATCSFRITDSERLHSFFNGKVAGTMFKNDEIDATVAADSRNRVSYRESFFAHDVREFVWKHGKWDKRVFYRAVDDFAPTVILVLASRTSFMLDIATEVSKRNGIPIVVLTGENEYFRKPKALNFWDHILRKHLKRSYWNMMPFVSGIIVTNNKIALEYANEFMKPVHVLMPSITLENTNAQNQHLDGKGLIYGGNLEPFRYVSLLEISSALHELAPDEVINVYSGDVSTKVKSLLDKRPNICLHDPVPKDELIKLISESKCVLHFESFGKKAAPLIQNAFSGKIAECLNSGVPFFVYAPDYCAFSPYFSAHKDSLFYVNNPTDLRSRLSMCLNDNQKRKQVVGNALALVKMFHNETTNSRTCLEILCQCTSNE